MPQVAERMSRPSSRMGVYQDMDETGATGEANGTNAATTAMQVRLCGITVNSI